MLSTETKSVQAIVHAGRIDSRSLDIVGKRNHANGLPDTQTYTRGNTSVQALDTIGLVDVRQCVEDCLFLGGSNRVGGLHGGLHLDSNDCGYSRQRELETRVAIRCGLPSIG